MGQARTVAVVLDTGALIAFERGNPKVRALLREVLASGARLLIPAGVLGQAWRAPARQVVLGSLVNAGVTEVQPLDRVLVEACGVLCGKRGTTDVVDASVALTARRSHAAVVTSDPQDLRRLDAALKIHSI